MAVPSSGELELRGDIALEVYGTATGSDISLGAMSDLAGFPTPDAMSDFYGYSSASAPSATTNSLSNITQTSMRLNGNITSDGGASITERGFYFGRNSSSPANNTKYTVAGTTGAYSFTATGLPGGSNHYCWAFATNSKGTTYGSRVNAATIPIFTPQYANLYRTNVLYVSGTNNPAGNNTVAFRKYYIDPYTNAYVQHNYSEVQTQNASDSQGVYNTIDADIFDDPAVTNARNIFRGTIYNFPSGTDYAYSSFQFQIYANNYNMTNRTIVAATMNGGPELTFNTSTNTYVRVYGYGYNFNGNTHYYDYGFDYSPQ
jgi:hypothetical protein